MERNSDRDGMFQGPSWEAYKNHLIKREALGGKVSNSSLSYHNRLGYYGIYQMGVQALEEIGYLKEGTYKKMKNNKLRQIDVLGDDQYWTGEKNLKWFSSKANQDQAMTELTKKNYRAIKEALKTKGIDKLSEIYGYLTSAHLGGATTTKKYIKTGKSSFKDANNTSVKKYKDSFASYYQKYVGDDTSRGEIVRGDRQPDALRVHPDDVNLSKATQRILDNVDMHESTLSGEDLKAIRTRVSELLKTGGDDLKPDGDFIDKTISLAYDRADQKELRDILVPEMPATIEMISPGIPEVDKVLDKKKALGGSLQPNGRVTTFSRPEDKKAQSKTTK